MRGRGLPIENNRTQTKKDRIVLHRLDAKSIYIWTNHAHKEV